MEKWKSMSTRIVLAILGVFVVMIPLLFVGSVWLGTHPASIPGLHAAEKKLAPELKRNIGALPPGFTGETNVMVRGGVSISAYGDGTVAEGAQAHRTLLDAIDAIDATDTGKTTIAPSTTINAGESTVTISGFNRANLDAMTELAEVFAEPALHLRLTLDEPKLLVRAGYQHSESPDSISGTAGPCAASRAEYISHISEVAALEKQGIPVEGDFMYCADNVPGAYFGVHVPARMAKGLDRLLNGPLGDTVFWAKVSENGNLYIRFKKGSESSEVQWRENWQHGELKVFQL